MKLSHGIFTISLDFELYWGLRDKTSIDKYEENLLGVPEVITEMLKNFENNDIHATWAIVGFLFFQNKEQMLKFIPQNKPIYLNENLSAYKYIEDSNNLLPEYHFCPEIVQQIKKYKHQEIGTHTFSHYYCLEKGQNGDDFREDLKAAIHIAKSYDIVLKSIVFPRNQINFNYLPLLKECGIKCYRGNQKNIIYNYESNNPLLNKLIRAARLIDSCINLTGYNTYNIEHCVKHKPYNFPGSHFLRPLSKKQPLYNELLYRRNIAAMKDAAVNKKIYHLWWHPHNFGNNIIDNIENLKRIINYYNFLHNKYGMQSLNMGELALLAERLYER